MRAVQNAFPIVDEIAQEVIDQKVGKINVDEQPGLASEFNVMSIPTLILFKDGKEVKRTMGVQPKQLVKKMLEG